MKADYVNPFLIASKKIIKTVLRLEMELGNIDVRESNEFEDIFIVMIGVNGDFRGRVLLCIKYQTVCTIASIMMDKPIKKLDELSESAVGELANMILGRSGIIFSNRGIKVNICPPAIIQGKKLTITPLDKKILRIPLKLSNNEFLEIGIEVTESKIG